MFITHCENGVATASVVAPVQIFVAPNYQRWRRSVTSQGMPPIVADFVIVSAITSVFVPTVFKIFQRIFVGDVSLLSERCYNSWHRVEDKQCIGEEKWIGSWRWRYYNGYKFFIARMF